MTNSFTCQFTGPTEYVAYMKPGEPYAGVMSEAHAAEIGSILILWNTYENDLTSFVANVATAFGSSSKPRMQHAERAEFLQTLLENVSSESLKRALRELVQRGSNAQVKRNALAQSILGPQGAAVQA